MSCGLPGLAGLPYVLAGLAGLEGPPSHPGRLRSARLRHVSYLTYSPFLIPATHNASGLTPRGLLQSIRHVRPERPSETLNHRV